MNVDNEFQTTCAVCRHQRRGCEENCVYAMYFPAERAEDFENVHALFGINTAMKIISSVEEKDRFTTAETLFLEAKLRKQNPVHGPVEEEMRLQEQIEKAKNELEKVRRQIMHFQQNKGS
ncbi:hypothetical protein CASFOL_006276 [Castilleja foliolosa]|uniref:LOB domain-containing protein n=1 Tax=Castilleja foliolosa TaxID=1961234 RepID=A0ABD3E5Y2_9LAMI